MSNNFLLLFSEKVSLLVVFECAATSVLKKSFGKPLYRVVQFCLSEAEGMIAIWYFLTYYEN